MWDKQLKNGINQNQMIRMIVWIFILAINRGPPPPGVRYITDDLLKKVSKQDELHMITTINLTLTKDTAGKKIKVVVLVEK